MFTSFALRTLASSKAFSAFLVLFAVIDPIGNIPNVLYLRRSVGHIEPGKAAFSAWLLMVSFLFVGEYLLRWFHIDLGSFSIAGAIVLLALGLEMVLELGLFKIAPHQIEHVSIIPLAFPMVAGTGTLTTLLTLRADYTECHIILGITLNSLLFYVAARHAPWIERRLGSVGTTFVRKIMGTLLMAIAVKIFKTHLFALS